ncbi:oxidoreductase [Epithele typhae]|uniref:oxidoreductase n=1 Tax=Epithele typhae TaxID=378194 RepID=UPI002007F5CC|nr:oxidoreductase [Epithele typhae]KAH9911101.1 oxidoreductase [Epithele typhae]
MAGSATATKDMNTGLFWAPCGSVDPKKFEVDAEEKRKDYPDSFNFVFGCVGTGETYRANQNEFVHWQIVPRVLRRITHRDLSVRHFLVPGSCDVPLPNTRFCPRNRYRSSASSMPHPCSSSTPRWFQLYWPLNEDTALFLLSLAKHSEYSTLVVTVDTMVIRWRYLDLDSGFLPFAHGPRIQIALSAHTNKSDISALLYNPAEIDKLIASGDARIKEVMRLAAAWRCEAVNGTFSTWQDDAEIAIDDGVDGIVVSTTAVARSPKSAQASNRFAVLVDGGIRSGADMLRALALGARAVLLGRAYACGLAITRQERVEAVTKNIAEFEHSLERARHQAVANTCGAA